MTTYAPAEEAFRRWAATAYNLPIDLIVKVDFYTNAGRGCPTCGPDTEVEAWVTMKEPYNTGYIKTDGFNRLTFREDGYDLTRLISDIVKAGIEA